jgi:hypothetical protein
MNECEYIAIGCAYGDMCKKAGKAVIECGYKKYFDFLNKEYTHAEPQRSDAKGA